MQAPVYENVPGVAVLSGRNEKSISLLIQRSTLNKVMFCVEQNPLISVTAMKTRPSVCVELHVQLPIGSDSILSSCQAQSSSESNFTWFP